LLVFGRRDLLVQLFGKQKNINVKQRNAQRINVTGDSRECTVQCCQQYKCHYAATSGQVALTWQVSVRGLKPTSGVPERQVCWQVTLPRKNISRSFEGS
jgi:hypothetical protein